jgi:hypothetical protein
VSEGSASGRMRADAATTSGIDDGALSGVSAQESDSGD